MGPGAYSKSKPHLKKTESVKLKLPLGGSTERFASKERLSPAPGEYNELNKWNKRTFNLKFLNGQS